MGAYATTNTFFSGLLTAGNKSKTSLGAGYRDLSKPLSCHLHNVSNKQTADLYSGDSRLLLLPPLLDTKPLSPKTTR